MADETVTTVIERTGGVPLFVEELTRALLESGDAKPSERDIPVTLHDSLMARLDRLGPAKEVAQVGAVLGREFSYELLRAVHPIADEQLQHALGTLADAELLYVRGIAPEATYQFKHALIRDAAYEALLKSRRKELHRVVARTIDGQFPSIRETHPEVLARHWTEAGETERAIAEWSRAGEAAQARNAFKEALDSYQQALTLLNVLPESPERNNRELQLRRLVVSTLNATKGYAAPETIAAIEEALPLAEKSGDITQLITWLSSKAAAGLVGGDLSGAGALADRILELAPRAQGGSINLGQTYQTQIITRQYRGDLAGAERHFSAWLAFFGDRRLQPPPPIAVNTFFFAGRNAWLLGRADVARERDSRMVASVKGRTPFDIANSEYCGASLEVYMGNYKRAETRSLHALELAKKYEFPNPAIRARASLGSALAHMGRATEGVALIRQAIAGMREIGSRMGITITTTELAEAQGLEGAVEDALETAELALRAHPEEVVHRPETLRIRGELRLKQEQIELGEIDFREAITLAQRMSAKSWELRATTSLARLLRDTGRRDEARTMLAEIYNWFTEGFDTADLKEAKALLNELGS
ncbi:MAG TPA: hypothetical protein VJN94_00055 [Candidatus Binataceae bacterium]|nr:hypothetical protein [Candidatus Binataceae bacterium]